MRIALFTPFSPEIGGGSTQLRDHLKELSELDVEWFYLSGAEVGGRNRKWLGRPLTEREFLLDLSARTQFLPGSRKTVREIVKRMEADLYWVVGHYEGISVAAELLEQGKKVHLTVHDDPFGTWIRSNRYRMFRPLLHQTFPKVLHGAESIDVTSWGMRNLYREKYGVKCFALYRHVKELPKLNTMPSADKLTVGHIGTLYRTEPFRQFVEACKIVATEQGKELRIVRIGTSPEIDAIAAENPKIFQEHRDLSEENAIPILAECDFVYAMYPGGKRYELFRKTSLPVKLSTYIQAQRPVFAHSPSDSTLARIVGAARLGRVCESERRDDIAAEIRKIFETSIPRAQFESLREELMGLTQVHQLRAALRRENWLQFPESDFRT